MANVQDDFELTLSTAAGNDPALIAELRDCFAQSLAIHLDLLNRARCDGNWQMAAQRLRGLGASFHTGELVTLADEALEGAPGDPAILRKLTGFAGRFSATA